MSNKIPVNRPKVDRPDELYFAHVEEIRKKRDGEKQRREGQKDHGSRQRDAK